MATTVVVGIGTGAQTRRLAQSTRSRLITIGFEGESPEHLPGRVFMVRGGQDAGEVISHCFREHVHVVDLEETAFYDTHDIAPGLTEKRTKFCTEFYQLLTRKPFDLGDDVIDGLQGAFHLAHNAKYLLPSPLPQELPKLDVPAIAIASGPSLSRHVDALRDLQDRCLLVACDSALEGLLKNGVFPHLVTPLERVEEVKCESFPSASYPGVIFAGNPAVHQSIAPLFERHIYMPGSDLLYLWGEAPNDRLNWFGQSTGTLAVCAAMNLTSGPIYLVGHDLAFSGDKSHWKEVAESVTIDRGQTFEVAGYSGQVATQYWWDVFRREIEGFAHMHGNIINTNAPDGVGAVIANTLSGSLPKRFDLPVFTLPEFPAPNTERLDRFRAKLKTLPGDARSLLGKLSSSQRPTPADLDLRKLCKSPNRLLFGYILRSVLAQFSMELRLRKQSVVVDAMMEAMRSSLRGCMGIFEEMAKCA